MKSKNEGKKRVNVYVDASLYEKIEADAERLGIAISPYFCVAASEYLKQNSVTDLLSYLEKVSGKSKNQEAEESELK